MHKFPLNIKGLNGTFPTASLFLGVDGNITDIEPVFTLFDDYPGLVNARTTFLELGDPTGYLWAMKYLGSMEHWTKLCNCKWFKPRFDEWVYQLKAGLRVKALDRIKEIAESQSAQSLAAAKYLATADWEKQETTRGRPSKLEVNRELKKQMALAEMEDEDYKRAIGITLKAV